MNLIKDILEKVCRKSGHKKTGFASLAIMMAAGFSGCSEDFDFREGINDVSDGSLHISFAVPDPIMVNTRAINESGLDNVEIFIFSSDNQGLIQHQSIESQYISDNTVHLALKDRARNANVTIYAVANVNSSDIRDASSIDELRKYELSQGLTDGYLPMIGYATLNTSVSNAPTVSLYRSEAKISAACKEGAGTVEGIEIYRNSAKGYLGAPVNSEEAYKEYKIHAGSAKTDAPGNEAFDNTIIYTYPSEGVAKADDSKGAYCVVKVKRSGYDKDMYYRLNLRKEVEGELTYLSLEPNHHYQITITGFMTNGYDTALEASKHPESDQFVIYEIHDHAQEVLSMITDGVNELGVSPEVIITLDEQKHRSGKLVVKCYAPGENVSADKLTIDYPKDWLTIGSPTVHNFADPDMSYDRDAQKGQQYEYEVAIKEGLNIYEDISWDITVTWGEKALSRTVKAYYQAAFLLPEVCKAQLTIKDNTDANKDVITDYWTFVTGQGTSVNQNTSSTPILYGILPENMTGDKKRNNGFHFPMPYGESNDVVTPWSYEYEIDFSQLTGRDDTGNSITNIEYEIKGDNFITQNVEWKSTGNSTGTLKLTGEKDSYQYATGEITFNIYFDGNTVTNTEIIAPVYHTGFFHYENRDKYTNKKGYYYYEVVPMGNEGDYWLDRNICATSNRSFIDISESKDIDRSAAGLHYTIISEPKNYELPTFDFGMCPPGYHVPNQTEWDNVRLSKNFITQSVNYDNTIYMSTYYNTNSSKIGNIYLQKARFVNENNIYNDASQRWSDLYNNGDAGAGYYWSVTEAPAMEKEQMGNWLRALYLNGSASSYTNASVTDHRMPVRCKAGTEKQATTANEYYVSLNVHEATHVYLFDTTNGSNRPLYTFPGHAVGTTSSAIKWQHFYCATTVDPKNIRAIFVKLEKDGKVTVYTRDGNSFKKNDTYSVTYLQESNSWPVNIGAYYDFCEEGKERTGGNVFDKNYMTSNFPGKDYPDDCITVDESEGGGGGGGEASTGNFTWTGWWQSDDAWDAWDGLGYGKYDWESVQPGSTLEFDFNIYYAPLAAFRLCQALEGWPIVYEVPFSGEGDAVVSVELTQDMIEKFAVNGMVVQCHKMGIRRVTLTLKE